LLVFKYKSVKKSILEIIQNILYKLIDQTKAQIKNC